MGKLRSYACRFGSVFAGGPSLVFGRIPARPRSRRAAGARSHVASTPSCRRRLEWQDAGGLLLVHRPARERGGARPKPNGAAFSTISPLKALTVDIERNLQAPLRGIASRPSGWD